MSDELDPEGIDDEMKRCQWLCWGHDGKAPTDPTTGSYGKHTDPETWGSWDDALAMAERKGYGVGFPFQQDAPFIGLDVDVPDSDGWVPDFGRIGGAVVERSPSGNWHVFLREVEVPEWWTDLSGDGPETDEIGTYADSKYTTVTGDILEGHGPPIEEVSQFAFNAWLKDAWVGWHEAHLEHDDYPDEVPTPPWEDSDSTLEGDFNEAGSSQGSGETDVDIGIYDVLPRSEHPGDERGSHPYHGSKSGTNFMVDEDGESFRCWRHEVTGHAGHLLGMDVGVLDCGEWDRREIATETWREIYDAAREAGDDIPAKDHTKGTNTDDQATDQATADGGTATTSATAEDVADSDEQEGPWDAIRREYALAEDADDRKPARFNATTQLREERYWANIEENDVLYGYDPETGVYEDRGESIVRNTLGEHLGEQFGGHELREILLQLRAFETVREREMGGPAGHIPAENGVLSVGGGEPELLPHDPEYRFLASLSTEYDPDADCPRFMQFLDEVVTTETARMKLQEYAGYTLMHWGLPYHKALFLVGPTASGKSTFLDTLRATHGERTVSSLAPQQMTQRFGGADLYGKWLNVRNDIPAAMIKNTGTFKEIVAGDRIKAEEKFKDPFHFSPTAKHLFSANQLPETETDDEAFYRRILLVPFPTSIPRDERDTHLDDKLQQELPGVLNWALEGVNRLTTQGRFTGDRTPGETQNTWEKWGKSIDRFRRVGLTDSVDQSVPKSRVYQAYIRFCQNENIPAETQHAMTRKLKTEGIEAGREYIDGKQERVFFGVCLSDRGQALLAEKGSATQSESSSDLPNDLRDY